MSLSSLAWKSLSFGYGTFTLGAFLLLSSLRKAKFRKLSADDKRELTAARERLWNLNERPFGLEHRFCTLRDGKRIHYVQTAQQKQTSCANLIIFIHGYPDSYALWGPYLKNPRLATRATMIAVDLPGFGGSDSLEKYGPDQVMEAMTDFILKMREQHLSNDGAKTIIVAHDWGAMVGFRLAAEAPQLADRFVMANCIHPSLAVANVKSRLASTKQMLRTWIATPSKLRLLMRALGNVAPLVRQAVKSGYVFVFNLPYSMATIPGAIGDYWWFRYLNAVSTHPDPSEPLGGSHGMELLASSIGPGLHQCTTAVNDTELAYPSAVRERAEDGGNREKLKYYRHGLAFQPWKKSIETLWELNQLQQQSGRKRSSSAGMLFDTSPEGSLKAPTTVIWGKGDIAIENAIALEGIRDYFAAPASQLIQVARCGHWSPIEKLAIPIFEEVLTWTITGEKESLKDRLGEQYAQATIVAER